MLGHQAVEGACRLGVPCLIEMQIPLDRDADRRVAEPLADNLDRNASRCEQRSMRIAETM